MSFLRSLQLNPQNLYGNGFQSLIHKVLASDGFGSRFTIGLPSIGINCIQKRQMAARRGKRIAANRAAMSRARIRREEAKNAGPKVWRPNKLNIDKSTLNVGPRRYSDEHLKGLDTLMDNVYITGLYKQMKYSLIEAIDMQRETHDRTQLNEPKALVESTVELDLRTKKKTKFCDAFKGIISYPNKFEFKANRRIIAICKKDEDKYDAKEAGADVVGGLEIIKMLQKGDLNMSNFDDLVCHGDVLIELAQIRGILQNHFPSKLKGNLGFDMKKLVNQFVNGIEYKCVKDDFESDLGWVRAPFGTLDMTDEELEHNFRVLLSTIEKHKPNTSIVPFITRVLIQSDPSKEEFSVKFPNYIDGYEGTDNSQESDDKSENISVL